MNPVKTLALHAYAKDILIAVEEAGNGGKETGAGWGQGVVVRLRGRRKHQQIVICLRSLDRRP